MDDHPLFRKGVVALLRLNWPSATVVECDGTSEAALNGKEPLPEVAAKLRVTYSTLNTYKRRLLRKLGKLPGLD